MANVYYVDDGGSNTAPYDTWAKAAPNLKVLDTAIAFSAGDVVYVGHDSVDSTATLAIIACPTGAGLTVISATTGSTPPAYQKSSSNQLAVNSGGQSYGLSNNANLYGIRLSATYYIGPYATNSALRFIDCTVAVGANGYFGAVFANANRSYSFASGLTIDLTADGTTNRTGRVVSSDDPESPFSFYIVGLSFVNAAYRTGAVVNAQRAGGTISGADFSGFTNGTTPSLVFPGYLDVTIRDSLTAATWSPMTADYPENGSVVRLVNVGPAYTPSSLIERTEVAQLTSTTSIYRTGGASVEGVSTAWLITTTSSCSSTRVYKTAQIVGTVDAGEKTFSVCITNDTADFTDAEVWLEVEYLSTSEEAITAVGSDAAATITTTPTTQTDDTTSTWNGTGPSFTYKQKLSVTATVGQAGQYRARVVVGKASIASSAYFYVDPLVTVS